jgi:glycerol-3-phosphate acyltransferase PlsY
MRLLLSLLICLLPTLSFGEAKPKVRLKTSEGDIVLELDARKAPLSTANFLSYVEKGFYEGTVFHRVISNFMIQGGGFTIDEGSLVQKATEAPIRNESQNGLKNRRGTIAMARTNDPHSATSQFFINVVDNPNLDYPSLGGYAVFGEVVDGMDVVDKIRAVATGTQSLTNRFPNGQLMSRPTPNVPQQPVIIEWAELVVPEAPQMSDALPEIPPVALSSFQLWLMPLFAFLLGSIPFGFVFGRIKGLDIREHGSGNIGATNVWRVLGRKFGIPCLILDALKGLVPVLLAVNLILIAGREAQLSLPIPEAWALLLPESQAITAQIIHILTALFAVLGHSYSPWVQFKGGKGIATSAGVLIGLMPMGLLILLAVWMILFFTTRYVSVASIGASLALPLLTLYGSWHHGRLQDGTWNKPLFIFACVIAVLATWKHRSNIRRLMAGTENRFTPKSKTS